VIGEPAVYEKWDKLPIERKRQELWLMITSVRVRRADPKRRRWQPIEERVEVVFREAASNLEEAVA